ncbi:MAG TPA: hypothetical protein VHT04_04400 [Stellaceae bacterium]|jgi:hypothetical protein|nr:hypothetical protein [Stellaceae bacterium]
MPLGKRRLDRRLPLAEPVERRIELGLVDLPRPSTRPRLVLAVAASRSRAVASFEAGWTID